MLFQATILVDLLAMAVTLWMAFYLFARGFPNTMTMRMVVVSLALSGFFYGAYNNVFVQIPGTAAIRAVLLVVVLGGWYSLIYQVMSKRDQQRFRWVKRGIYSLGVVSIFLLLQPGAFIREEGNALHVAHMNNAPPYLLYSLYQFLASFGIMWNLLVSDRVGLTSRGKYYFVASIFPVLSVIYGVISLGGTSPAPRIIQDTLAFLGIFILNLAVARHQIWTERRATLQDFPLTTFSVLGLAGLYGFVAWDRGMSVQYLSSVVGLAIVTLGSYDLVREFLERQRMRNESWFRKQLHRFEIASASADAVKAPLQDGLDLLCQTLHAPGGFVAVRQGDEFIVLASKLSLPMGSGISASDFLCEDVSHPKAESLSSLAWIAPAFDGQAQVAVVGIDRHLSKLDYSTGDLDLLAEVAEHIGKIVMLGNRMVEYSQQAMNDTHVENNAMSFAANEMIASISVNPNGDFIKLVEDGLRHYADFIVLGQSPLAEWAGIRAQSHVERGKELQKVLLEAIDSFRPVGIRPHEPLPRMWYSYAVLHDAYVEGVPNREIMARLYISEGTFNRTRRNALRGLARLLMEKNKRMSSMSSN